jgi:hypothetical protein
MLLPPSPNLKGEVGVWLIEMAQKRAAVAFGDLALMFENFFRRLLF